MEPLYTSRMPFSKQDFPNYTWQLSFQNPQSSLFQSLSISLIEVFIKLKDKSALFLNFKSNFEAITAQTLSYIGDLNLNSSILQNYTQLTNTILQEPDIKNAFAYLRYYSESDNPHMTVTIEYGMRFILIYLLQSDPILQNQLLNNLSYNWQKCLNKFSEKFNTQINLIENTQITIFGHAEKSLLIISLYKENESFKIIYPNDFFELFSYEKSPESSFNLSEQIKSDLFISPSLEVKENPPTENKNIISSETINELSSKNLPLIILPTASNQNNFLEENKEIDRNLLSQRTSITKDKCRVTTFISCLDLIITIFSLPALTDDDLKEHLIKKNIIKEIFINEITAILIHIIPDQLFSTRNVKKLSKHIHKIFKQSAITINELNKILNRSRAAQVETINKKSLITIIILIIKCLIRRKEVFNSTLETFSSLKLS